MTKPNLYMHLRRFTEDVARVLGKAVSRGEWIPFELVEEPAGSSVLYNYRSLVGDFIDSKWDEISSLESFKLASGTLTCCKSLDQYLSEFGPGGAAQVRTAREGAALAVFVNRIWRDSSDMDLSDGQFETAYAELEEFGITGNDSVEEAGDDGVWLEQSDVKALAAMLNELESIAPEQKRMFLQSASPLIKLRLQRHAAQLSDDRTGMRDVGRMQPPLTQAGAQIITDERLSGPAVATTGQGQTSTGTGGDWIGGHPEELSLPLKRPTQISDSGDSAESSLLYDDIEDANDFSAPV